MLLTKLKLQRFVFPCFHCRMSHPTSIRNSAMEMFRSIRKAFSIYTWNSENKSRGYTSADAFLGFCESGVAAITSHFTWTSIAEQRLHEVFGGDLWVCEGFYKASNSSILCLVLPWRIWRRVLYLSRPAWMFLAWSRSFWVFLFSYWDCSSSELRACGGDSSYGWLQRLPQQAFWDPNVPYLQIPE